MIFSKASLLSLNRFERLLICSSESQVKKVIHCTYLENKISSIYNHCREEKASAGKENLPWEVYLHISSDRIKSDSKFLVLLDRLKYYFEVFKFSRNYEMVLLRYIPADPFFALLVLSQGNGYIRFIILEKKRRF
jgi:hypothetical protein